MPYPLCCPCPHLPRSLSRWPNMCLVLLLLQLWVLAAKLEVRCQRLDAARRILGTALGVAPKDKTFKAYIELELQLGNVDRCALNWGSLKPRL